MPLPAVSETSNASISDAVSSFENSSVAASSANKRAASELDSELEQALPPVKSGTWTWGSCHEFTTAIQSQLQYKEDTYYGPWNRVLNEVARDLEAAADSIDNRCTCTVFPRLSYRGSVGAYARYSVDPIVTFEVCTSATIVVIVEVEPPKASDQLREDQLVRRFLRRLVDDRVAHTVYLISAFGVRCKTFTATWTGRGCGYDLDPKPFDRTYHGAAGWNWRIDTEEGAMELRRMF